MLSLLVVAGHVVAWLVLRRPKQAGHRCNDNHEHQVSEYACDGRAVTSAAGPIAAAVAAAAAAEHPHAAVIEQLSQAAPPLRLPPQPDPRPPPPLDNGKEAYVYVDTVPKLAAAAMELYEQDRVALDCEHHSEHTYAGMTCLLQLSTGSKDFLIDCLALPRGEVRRLLAPVLCRPRVCKVVHGAGNDVAWLQRDFGVFMVNIFDTEKACQVLGFQQRNLGILLQRFCGVSIDKSAGQLADWRQRPLPPDLVEYARRDVHHLLHITDCLGQLLVQDADHQQAAGADAALADQAGGGVRAEVDAQREVEAGTGGGSALAAGGGDRDAGKITHAAETTEAGPPAIAEAAGGISAAAEAAAASQAVQAPAHPVPPPSVVELSPAARDALAAAMSAPHSKLRRAVHRSQAVALSIYRPTPPSVAVSTAAVGIMRRHVAALLERHARLTPEQVQQLETLADCVHALASWRDAAARTADEGLQCLLPDAMLLTLAEAAAASIAPGDCNLRGRQQGLSERQLLALLPEEARAHQGQQSPGQRGPPACAVAGGVGPNGGSAGREPSSSTSCGCYPAVLRQQASEVAALLSEAARAQRPWVCAEIQELLCQAGGGGLLGPGGGGGGKAFRRHNPEAFRQRLAERFSCKGKVYENARMYSMEGELLCHTDKRKLEWYLRKGLAEKMSDDPLCVRLTFKHKTGDQQQGTSEFYTVEKANRCVACGEAGHYLRYRVVPTCYRKAMPVSLKSHRSHDVVLLCVTCHELAQSASEKLKRVIAEETSIPLNPPIPQHQLTLLQQRRRKQQTEEEEAAEAARAADAAASKPDMRPFNVRRSALALQRYGHQMPAAKRRQLEHQVRCFLGSANPADEEGDSGLTPLELCGGLLAGLGRRSRRRSLRRWVHQGRELPPELAAEAAAALADGGEAGGGRNCLDQDPEEDVDGESQEIGEGEDGSSQLAPEHGANGSHGGAAEAGQQQEQQEQQPHIALGPDDLRATGHAWHGQQVVDRLMAEGGEEALLGLCRRFRGCFVDALQPQFLPAGWAVYHFAKREFGQYSIYTRGAA